MDEVYVVAKMSAINNQIVFEKMAIFCNVKLALEFKEDLRQNGVLNVYILVEPVRRMIVKEY